VLRIDREDRHGGDLFTHSYRPRKATTKHIVSLRARDRPDRGPLPPKSRMLTSRRNGLESGPNNRDRGRPTPK
jgi:hypothetical protein